MRWLQTICTPLYRSSYPMKRLQTIFKVLVTFIKCHVFVKAHMENVIMFIVCVETMKLFVKYHNIHLVLWSCNKLYIVITFSHCTYYCQLPIEVYCMYIVYYFLSCPLMFTVCLLFIIYGTYCDAALPRMLCYCP